jgi:hypothetical protein
VHGVSIAMQAMRFLPTGIASLQGRLFLQCSDVYLHHVLTSSRGSPYSEEDHHVAIRLSEIPSFNVSVLGKSHLVEMSNTKTQSHTTLDLR